MTTEEKTKWLQNASNEAILKQYQSALHQLEREPLNNDFQEDVELAKIEIIKRMEQ